MRSYGQRPLCLPITAGWPPSRPLPHSTPLPPSMSISSITPPPAQSATISFYLDPVVFLLLIVPKSFSQGGFHSLSTAPLSKSYSSFKTHLERHLFREALLMGTALAWLCLPCQTRPRTGFYS